MVRQERECVWELLLLILDELPVTPVLDKLPVTPVLDELPMIVPVFESLLMIQLYCKQPLVYQPRLNIRPYPLLELPASIN